MEKFLEPKDKKNFIRWLLEESTRNKWILVFEYTGDEGYMLLRDEATVVNLPISAGLNYSDDCKLTAAINPIITLKLIDELIKKFHVLSIHNDAQMIFLIADDFHLDCFSCSFDFYSKYYNFLLAQDLIKNN